MKKVLYGIFAITALAATSVYAAPVQVGEAAGSAATSASAGSSTATATSTVGSAVGVALAATGGGDGSNTGTTHTGNHDVSDITSRANEVKRLPDF